MSAGAFQDPLGAAQAALRARQGAGARYDAHGAPHRELAWARLGAAYFARKLNELSDQALRTPSARPGWSRRRVIAASALEARAIAQAILLASGTPPDEFAQTDAAALDLAEELPARALRHLVAHAEIHLNVVWRDLADDGWDMTADMTSAGISAPSPRASPGFRAIGIWQSAMMLGNGGKWRDAPAGALAFLQGPRGGATPAPSPFVRRA